MNWRSAIWNLVAIAIGSASGYGIGVASRSLLQGIISGIVFGGLVWLAYRWFPNAEHASTDSSTSPADSPAVADDIEEGMKFYDNKDYATALTYFLRAAERGDPETQYKLGLMYAQGQGVTRDDEQAVSWFQKSAEQGYAPAQSSLGVCYATGQGVAQDHIEAHKWLSLAVASGDEAARGIRDDVEKQMSREQIADAQRRAAEW